MVVIIYGISDLQINDKLPDGQRNVLDGAHVGFTHLAYLLNAEASWVREKMETI